MYVIVYKLFELNISVKSNHEKKRPWETILYSKLFPGEHCLFRDQAEAYMLGSYDLYNGILYQVPEHN